VNAAQRTERARTAARARWANVRDTRAATETLWSASPTGLRYWLARADPDGVLDPAQRQARAVELRSGYQRRLGQASALRRVQSVDKV
jgi:hypothetical protein